MFTEIVPKLLLRAIPAFKKLNGLDGRLYGQRFSINERIYQSSLVWKVATQNIVSITDDM